MIQIEHTVAIGGQKITYVIAKRQIVYRGIQVTIDVTNEKPIFAAVSIQPHQGINQLDLSDALDLAHELSIALRYYLQQSGYTDPTSDGFELTWVFHQLERDEGWMTSEFREILKQQLIDWYKSKQL